MPIPLQAVTIKSRRGKAALSQRLGPWSEWRPHSRNRRCVELPLPCHISEQPSRIIWIGIPPKEFSMCAEPVPALDMDAVHAFAFKVIGDITASQMDILNVIADRLGLFNHLAG